jgi:hypothetical protein
MPGDPNTTDATPLVTATPNLTAPTILLRAIYSDESGPVIEISPAHALRLLRDLALSLEEILG